MTRIINSNDDNQTIKAAKGFTYVNNESHYTDEQVSSSVNKPVIQDKDDCHTERCLDRELEDTFPASDPLSISLPCSKHERKGYLKTSS